MQRFRLGKGKKRTLLKLEQWQQDWVRALLGTLKPDGLRQYTNGFLFIPRKNGKTTLIAALCLALLICESEYGAEIYCAAASRDQASIIYKIMVGMINQDRSLGRCLQIRQSRKEIYYKRTDSTIKAISSDAYNQHGYNAHIIVADELHAWPDRELWDVLQTSTASRDEPLTLAITTAGFDKTSLCYEIYTHAKKCLADPEYDPSFLPVIYEADEGADWQDVNTYIKCNPNYGISVKPEYIAREIIKAKQQPRYLNTLLRLHANVWTQAEVRWLDQTIWEAAGKLNLSELDGMECTAGLDLASTGDTAAFVMAFRQPDGAIALHPRIYIPEARAGDKERVDGVPYLQWAREGHIHLTPGNVIDYDYIRSDIVAMSKLYKIKSIAIDRWNSTQLATQLQKDGLTPVFFGQGYASMSAPSKRLELLLRDRKLAHPNNSVMNWQAGNVVVEMDAAENIKPNKAKSTARIDSIVAAIMAIGIQTIEPETKPYEGLLLL